MVNRQVNPTMNVITVARVPAKATFEECEPEMWEEAGKGGRVEAAVMYIRTIRTHMC